MRVPTSYASSNQQQHLATTVALSINCNGRRSRSRSRSRVSDMSTVMTALNNDDAAFIRPCSLSPPPTSGSGTKSATPPTVPGFLQDPVLNRTYARGRFLGKGGFAWCYEVTDVQTRVAYALKVVPKSRVVKQRHRNKVLREISIHYPLRHVNVVKLHSAFEDDDNIYMALELCELDSLVSLIKKRKALTESECRYYMYQLLTGVKYLHDEARILHRDLKLGNMLLTDQMQLKICDFGLATEMGDDGCDHCGQVCGTPNYISPEVLRKQGHSEATEAWAIGCIMYAMLVGKPPFETNSLETTYAMIVACQYSYPPRLQLSTSALDLIRRFLNQKAEIRPTATQALSHEFFAVPVPYPMTSENCNTMFSTGQFSLFTPSDQMKAIQTAPMMSSAHCYTETPAQFIVVHSATTATTMYRSSTPFFEERRRLVALNDGTNAIRMPPTSMRGHCHGGQPIYMPPTFVQKPISSTASTYSYQSVSSSAPSSSGSSSSSRSVCAMDAFGNTTFGSERENALTQWLYMMHSALKDVLSRPLSSSKDLVPNGGRMKSNNILYVIKWIDYSNRYGFGCQFNNGGVSIMQNDRKRLCVAADRRFCRLWRYNARGCVNGSDLLDLLAPVDAVKDSFDLIRHFVEYMDANLMTGGYSENVTPLTSAVPFIVLWRRFAEYLLIVLSDGTFQVNFTDQHTKVVLSRPLMYQSHHPNDIVVTFIDKSRKAHTGFLTNCLGSIIDKPVLQCVCQLLGDFVLSPNECFTAEL